MLIGLAKRRLCFASAEFWRVCLGARCGPFSDKRIQAFLDLLPEGGLSVPDGTAGDGAAPVPSPFRLRLGGEPKAYRLPSVRLDHPVSGGRIHPCLHSCLVKHVPMQWTPRSRMIEDRWFVCMTMKSTSECLSQEADFILEG